MNFTEERFRLEFMSSMLLLPQPNVLTIYNSVYRADFLDVKTDTYYEIVSSPPTYYKHRNLGHFRFADSTKKLVLAIYIKELDFFFLLLHTASMKRLTLSGYRFLIRNKYYVRRYGDGTVIFQFKCK